MRMTVQKKIITLGLAFASSMMAGNVMAQTQACETALPAIEITGTEGIAASGDTLYFSQREFIGRWSPSAGLNKTWASVPGASTIWGLAMDDVNNILYFATPTQGGKVMKIDLSNDETPFVETVSENLGAPNGLTFDAESGLLFTTDFGGGRVIGIDPENGEQWVANSTAIPSPNGIIVEDNTLVVLSYRTGNIHRISLDSTKGVTFGATEASSELVFEASPQIRGNWDGILPSPQGGYFLSDNGGGNIIYFSKDFTPTSLVTQGVSAAANMLILDEGEGCQFLAITSAGPLRLIQL